MAEVLWTAAELADVLGTAIEGQMPGSLGGVSIDTRTLKPGQLFFAIQGDRTDGHDYLNQAFAVGASLAVVRADFDGSAVGPLLRVPDTLEALNALGVAGRERSGARIVAVTGSVGKTGTKEMLRLMLGAHGPVHASDKSYNNHWGVPLSLARLPRAAKFAVFEIGMNHAREITPLTKMVRPHVAVITTVAPVHMEFFDSIEAIAEAKAEIFSGLEPGGAAVLNMDIPQFELLAARAKERRAGVIVNFGAAPGAEARLLSVAAAETGSDVEAEIFGETVRYRLGAPGEHLAMNSVAALAAVSLITGDAARGAAELAAFGAPPGRGAQSVHEIAGGRLLLIDESYNANPASVGAALKVLGSARWARRIAVLGDMLELGGDASALHRALAGPLAEAGIDRLYACGPHMAALFEAVDETRRGAWAASSEALQPMLMDTIAAGDAVMIKGSLGSRMGLLVEAIKRTYPQIQGAARLAAD